MAPFHLLLLLAAVPFLHPTMGDPATAYRTYIVFLSPPADAAAMSRGAHRQWHETFLPSSLTESGEPRMVCSYSAIFHGFAARLTEAELAEVAKMPGFLRAVPDGKRELLTTRTPSFLGLSRDEHRLWSDTGYGGGVVIGIMDSGIHGQHVSFADDGVPEPPARWKGNCTGGEDTQCNRKLVGAKSFVGDADPRDDEIGHGTHVAAIAAGNFAPGAALRPQGGPGTGTAAGIAPLAHIAAYKVCPSAPEDDDEVPKPCYASFIACGIEEAIHDGVDVINISLGSSPQSNTTLERFDMDPVAIGAFRAMANGIVVVTAGGNDGPKPSTVTNDAPWMFTVGAGSVDRHFDAEVGYVYGSATTITAGEALNQPDPAASVLIGRVVDRGQCLGVRSDDVAYKLVVCEAVLDTEVQESVVQGLQRAGAAAAVLVGTEDDGYTTTLSDFGTIGFSVVQVDTFHGDDLRDYAKTVDAVGTLAFNGVVLGVRAPVVASFSSRGPSRLNGGLLKPDVLAPGLNIISAASVSSAAYHDEYRRFKMMSGTSMASPHIAGVVALLKSAHPDWSPAAIKSAILTTADTVDNEGERILDKMHDDATSFAMGAGHVNASRATDPGLVYDLTASDYAAYICGLLGDEALKTITGDPNSTCSATGSIPQALLNYPTVTLPLKNTPMTVPRTLTNVGPPETYTATVQGPSWMDIRVSPDTLEFSQPGEKKTFNVTVTVMVTAGGETDFVEGSFIWVSTKHMVRSPVVAVAGLADGGF
jgi:subtilisin family serine protease